jgi:NarL family two-component system response regulator LiaR
MVSDGSVTARVGAEHMTGATLTRILIVDDQALAREGLASLLAGIDDMEVVGAVRGAAEALDGNGEAGVDVVLMSTVAPEEDAAAAIAALRERLPHVEVIVIAGRVTDLSVRAVVEAGARACLLQDVSVDELAQAIRSVTRGRSVFSSEFVGQLLARPDDHALHPNLTAREHDVLPLLAAGMTNRGIADELGLTPGTVRVYVSAILAKLGVANRTEASVVAIRERLIHARVPRPPVPGAPP